MRSSHRGTMLQGYASLPDECLELIFAFASEQAQNLSGSGGSGGSARGEGGTSPSASASERGVACSGSCDAGGNCGCSCSPAPASAPAASAATSIASVLPLVCRSWRRVFHTSPLLHGTLSLDLAQLEAQAQAQAEAQGEEAQQGRELQALRALLRLLALRAQAARRLWLHSEGSLLRMAVVLGLLSPRRLQSVYLGPGAPSGSLALLQRFPQLRSLDLPAAACEGGGGGGCSGGNDGGGGGLAGFGGLEELTLRESLSPALVRSLPGLPRLRLLSMTLAEALPLGDLHRQLGRLHGLEELHIYLAPAGPAPFEFNPGTLSELTHLRCMLLIATSSLCEALRLGPGLPRLAALQELQVDSRVEPLPSDLWACQQLTRLDLDLKGSAALPPVPTPHGPAAASPLPALRELRLARCRLPGGAVPPALCQLSGLQRLDMHRCGLASGCIHQGLPPQFSQLSLLRHLNLEGNMLCTLPPAIAALPALRHLDCSYNPLTWLPPGPYLHSLETLILSANRISTVPPVLSQASCLEVLDLSGNPALQVSMHDVAATLSRMPRLALLLLGKQAACPEGRAPLPLAAAGLEWPTPSVAALIALGQALPHLQIDFEHTAAEFEGV